MKVTLSFLATIVLISGSTAQASGLKDYGICRMYYTLKQGAQSTTQEVGKVFLRKDTDKYKAIHIMNTFYRVAMTAYKLEVTYNRMGGYTDPGYLKVAVLLPKPTTTTKLSEGSVDLSHSFATGSQTYFKVDINSSEYIGTYCDAFDLNDAFLRLMEAYDK